MKRSDGRKWQGCFQASIIYAVAGENTGTWNQTSRTQVLITGEAIPPEALYVSLQGLCFLLSPCPLGPTPLPIWEPCPCVPTSYSCGMSWPNGSIQLLFQRCYFERSTPQTQFCISFHVFLLTLLALSSSSAQGVYCHRAHQAPGCCLDL